MSVTTVIAATIWATIAWVIAAGLRAQWRAERSDAHELDGAENYRSSLGRVCEMCRQREEQDR